MNSDMSIPFSPDVENHPLRLNSSSFTSPSDSNINSELKKNLVNFEQFHPNCQNKKKLTIVIDESYGFQASSQSKIDPLAFHKSNEKYHEEVSTPLSELGLLSPVENVHRTISTDYNQILFRLSAAEQKNQSYEVKIQKLQQYLQQKETETQLSLKKKDQLISHQQKKIDQLVLQLNQHEQRQKQTKFYDEKMREKQIEIMKLNKLTERLRNINKDLTKELKTNERKVRDLEGEVQKTVYHATLNNLHKLKESSLKSHNKENNTTNGGRKSLERKKSGVGIKKTQRIASSSSTLLTKKLMPK